MMKYLFLISVSFIVFFDVMAQTCCSSGLPIASNIGFQPQNSKVLQLSLALESNKLSALYNENQKLDDNNRLRRTNSLMLRIAYNLNKRLIIETLIPAVSQNRTITQNNGSINKEGGFGLGDLTILGQYVFLQNQFSQFNAGGGIKLPTGRTDLENSLGLLLVNDLQLGSGAVDYFARVSTIRNLKMRPSVSFFFNATAVFRGIDDDYLGSVSYKFGNEIQANIGYSDQLFFLKTLIYPSASMRFRSALQDNVNNNLLSNTGGAWIFARVTLGVDIYKGSRLNISAEIPLYTKVDGTQLSPTHILNFSYYKAIDFSKSEF